MTKVKVKVKVEILFTKVEENSNWWEVKIITTLPTTGTFMTTEQINDMMRRIGG